MTFREAVIKEGDFWRICFGSKSGEKMNPFKDHLYSNEHTNILDRLDMDYYVEYGNPLKDKHHG